jgi:hypothetical protein
VGYYFRKLFSAEDGFLFLVKSKGEMELFVNTQGINLIFFDRLKFVFKGKSKMP